MVRLPGIGGKIRDLNRLREILTIFTRHGFGFLIDQLNLAGSLPAKFRIARARKVREATPQRLRQMLEELGPTFIKLGQALSMRPDMLPPAYIQELSKLQDHVAPFSRPTPEQVIHQELGEPVSRLFKSFTRKPMAAASIAQVHRAVTWDNHQVVIKLQRPELKRRVDSDLEILRFLARAWEKFEPRGLPRKPSEFVDEVEQVLQTELDFLNEARHQEHFAKNFRKRPAYQFPRVYWDLSTSRCLTLEYIIGRRLGDLADSRTQADKHRLAQILLTGYVHMALEDHFFHADPHPGNFLITPQGRLALLDAGQVGRLDQETAEAFSDMLLALVEQNTESVVDAYLRLGMADDSVDRRRLKRDTAVFLERYYHSPLESISFGKALQDVVGLSRKHRVQLPPDFLVLVKTFLGAEGLARRLDPKLNLIEAARPTAQRLLRRRYAPGEVAKRFFTQLQDLRRFLGHLPAQLQDLLGKLQHGRLKLEFEHRGLQGLQQDIDRTGNRLSFAIIVAALIMGSAWILASQVGPRFAGLSVLGLIGFLLAGAFGLLLIIAIMRSGRM